MKIRLCSSSSSRRRKGGIFALFFAHLFIIIIIHAAVASSQSNGINDDVIKLMAFKKSSVTSDPHGVLANWTDTEEKHIDPCSWYGVTCSSSIPSRVTALDLSYSGLVGTLNLFNLTSMSALRRLYLQGNSFSTPTASSTAAACVLLDTLDLSCNEISDLAFLTYTLSGCPNLNMLNFSSNKIAGNISNLSVSSKNLSFLDLSHNLLSGQMPPAFVADLMISLNHLDLSYNNLSLGQMDLGQCSKLTVLNLSHNSLSEFPPEAVANCTLLEELDLSRVLGGLSSSIPGSMLGSFKRLRRLSLSQNQLIGEIPPELGRACGTLEELDLSSNHFTGGLPDVFATCSYLHALNLGKNQLSGGGDGDFLDKVVSNLKSLRYLNVSFNNITGYVPLSITNNCTQLQVLDLSSNGFTGNIPSGFCSASASASVLQKLHLADNYLSGSVPSELGNCKSLRAIDLSFNSLTGPIPSEIWTLPNLSDLVMWANNLTGEIPQGICDNGSGNLESLILNNNLITGTIPQSIGKCTNMIWVSLSSNSLTGEIPAAFGNLLNLAILQLGNNSLTGQIPPELGNCPNLIWLDLNSNALSGNLPPQLANQAGLVLPGLVSGKQFAFVRNEGGTACRGAGGLVEFEGIRAERLESFPMVHSCPSTRIYSGMTVYTFASNGSMIYLDLSYNSLSGTIPDKFGAMSYLQVLNLGHNMLSGNIPYSFGGLKAIGVLDLSHNDLNGFLPGSLGGLSFLSDLDVSNNNLTGPIPSGGQLTTFPASRYDNNSGLCGVPLPPCTSGGRRSTDLHAPGKKLSMETIMGVGITFFILCILVLALALFRARKVQFKDETREKYIESLPTSGGSSSWKLSSVPEPLSINIATFEKPLRKLTFAHLLEATNGFSAGSLIGSGGFGEVYKAQLKDGSIVAIKKLRHVTGQGDREFVAEMETIGKIKHRNLVPLLGYCKIGEERLLVYEYMKWGSLECVLHDRSSKSSNKDGYLNLNWAARKKIAIGSARGLAFLHHSCIPHIIHRDMKSSNVLLDQNFEARVSDFGMARLVSALDTHLSVSTLAGTPGYVPPEYYQSFRCTTKGDVYSYGVVLLELLSGKRPIDTSEFGDDNNLVGWAKQLHKEKRINEILDPEVMAETSGEGEELYHYLRIAFQCLDDRAFKRPTMIQVMAMFKELQVDSETSDILDGLSLKDVVIEEPSSGEKMG